MSTRVPREKAVFCQALEITDPQQRRQFLDQACGADKALREQVDKLLGLTQSAGDFFTECRPALEAAAADADPAQILLAAESALEAGPHESDRIGPYKLLQRIGEGGCGVVYMAEQEQPIRRRVALKIIKLGMDTKSVIARFEAERQALAGGAQERRAHTIFLSGVTSMACTGSRPASGSCGGCSNQLLMSVFPFGRRIAVCVNPN